MIEKNTYNKYFSIYIISLILTLGNSPVFAESVNPLLAKNYNQRSVLNYILATGGNNTVNGSIALATPQEFYTFLNQFSAATYANQQVELTRVGQQFQNQLADRIDKTQLCFYDETQGIFLEKETKFLLCDGDMAWVVGYGGESEILNTDISGLGTTNFGGSFGVQWIAYDDIVLGTAVSYGKFNEFVTGNESGRLRGSLYQLGIYGWDDIENWRLGFSFDYGRTDRIDLTRNFDLPFGMVSNFSQYYLTLLSGQVRTSYRMDSFYNFYFQPVLAGMWQHVNATSFLENSGTELDLYLHFKSYYTAKSQLGTRIEIAAIPQITPVLFIAWEHNFTRPYGEFNANIIGSFDQFNIHGTEIGRDALAVEAGFSFINNTKWELTLLYQGHFGDGIVENVGKMELAFF